jgi:two-component system, OmpR family, response regulator
MRVLVADHDVAFVKQIRGEVRAHGMLADVAITGEAGLAMAVSNHYDVVSLDLELPDIDGLETCRRMRANGVDTPVLLLSAQHVLDRVIAGLDGGADDYLAKPVHVPELLARLRALGRRAQSPRPPVLEVGDLRYDQAACRVHRGDQEIELTAKERTLLEVLMRHPGQIVSERRLKDEAWDVAEAIESNIVAVYVRYLRNKIDRPFGLNTIETVRGAGYRLTAPASVAA